MISFGTVQSAERRIVERAMTGPVAARG